MTAMIFVSKGVCARIDPTDGSVIYRGYPAAGTTSEVAPSWAISRQTVDSVTGVVSQEEWVNGRLECSYKWCSRADYTYSIPK